MWSDPEPDKKFLPRHITEKKKTKKNQYPQTRVVHNMHKASAGWGITLKSVIPES